jgi:hypothetical protein
VTRVFGGKAEASYKIEERKNGGSEDDKIAAADGISGICRSGIDSTAGLGPLEDGSTIAADHVCGEVSFLESETERASDQAGSDDGDLAKGHAHSAACVN